METQAEYKTKNQQEADSSKGYLQTLVSSHRARKIVGDNGKDGRKIADFYPTPNIATIELLKRETFNGNVWECACGKGDISKILESKGYSVFSTDLNNYGYGKNGFNFLDDTGLFSNNFKIQDNIITNPPFKYALEFILQAKKYSRFKIAMFLKTVFLEGQKRYEMFQDKKYPLRTVYQFSSRINFGEYENGGMMAFAWFVWEKGYKGKPIIEWIR